jgi:hypothetical protein
MANFRSRGDSVQDHALREPLSPLSPFAEFGEKERMAKSKEYVLSSVDTTDSSTMEKGSVAPTYVDDDGFNVYNSPPETAKDLVTEVISIEDDPTLSPWTFRTWFLGE